MKQGATQKEALEAPFLKVVNVSVNLFLTAFFYKIVQYSTPNKQHFNRCGSYELIFEPL